MDIQEIAEYIEKNYWAATKILDKNKISLLNFHITGDPCIIDLNENSDSVIVENFLQNMNKNEFNTVVEELEQNFKDVELSQKGESLTLVLNKSKSENDYTAIIDKIFLIYDYIFEKFSGITEKTMGIRKIASMGKPVYIVKRDDLENLKLIRGLFLTKPDAAGKYTSNYGDDSIKRPVLSWKNKQGELIATYIDAQGKLSKINLTTLKEKINDILTRLGLPERVNEDTVLDIEKLNEALYKARIRVETGEGFFIPVETSTNVVTEELKREVKELKKEVEKIIQLKTFDNYVREKVLLKLIAHSLTSEEDTLQAVGAKQLLTTKIRTVTKLGGGKAVYIGREELRLIELKDKALVSVIQLPSGKKIILVQPENE